MGKFSGKHLGILGSLWVTSEQIILCWRDEVIMKVNNCVDQGVTVLLTLACACHMQCFNQLQHVLFTCT